MFGFEPKLALSKSWHTCELWLLFGWAQQFWLAQPSLRGSGFFANAWTS
jgi:hypothetical protein